MTNYYRRNEIALKEKRKLYNRTDRVKAFNRSRLNSIRKDMEFTLSLKDVPKDTVDIKIKDYGLGYTLDNVEFIKYAGKDTFSKIIKDIDAHSELKEKINNIPSIKLSPDTLERLDHYMECNDIRSYEKLMIHFLDKSN